MQLGFVSSIFDTETLEETLKIAQRLGFSCIEAAAWPAGEAERRYAGVSHIDAEKAENLYYASSVKVLCEKYGVSISALAYYPNTLDPNLRKRKANIEHLLKVIDAAKALNISLVTTFIGRDQYKNVEENLELVKEVWPPILAHARQQGIRIAIENCPMLFGPDQWPGGQNLMTSPVLWQKVFDLLDSDILGLNFDPSHFVWQQMDYVAAVYKFQEKIFHVHFKDLKVRRDLLNRCGVLAYPLEFMTPKIPGQGEVNFGAFVSALNDVGYSGPACIEVEDRAFEGSKERKTEALAQAKQYMNLFVR